MNKNQNVDKLDIKHMSLYL